MPESPSNLATALVAAQKAARALSHDKRNDFHKYDYTSAEAILAAGRKALTAAGLALVPTGGNLQILNTSGESFPPLVVLIRSFLLLHTSGESVQLSCSWPVVPDKGRPLDKATASADTTSLAYLIRDLLCLPRVQHADDLAAREDRSPAPHPSSQPKPPQPSSNGTAPIGEVGAQKILEMAKQKGANLNQYLEAHGVTRFQSLRDIPHKTGLLIFSALSALPNPVSTQLPY